MKTSSSRFLLALLGSGALVAYSGAAFAQAAQANAPDELLGEVIVTATKQADVISRVPMSIVAQTQKSLDQQNIKTAQDLNRIVPSLVITANGQTGSNISLRGIRSNVAGGAATTGVYLDDTALQSRSLAGIANGGGAFLPILFDLERVEVLKGPQGTLYGGSSEGGTIKFITPAPSVTRYSAYGKAEINSTYMGSMGFTGGVAVGGPIVQDKLGFRASIYYNHIGGWVDHLDRNANGAVLESDTNKANQRSARLAVLWKPTERLSITPSVYMAYDKKADSDGVYIDMAQYTVPTKYYSAPLAGGTFTRLNVTTPPVVNPPNGLITAPGYTVGPYNFLTSAKYGSLVNTLVGENYASTIKSTPVKTPRTSTLFLPSLTLQYDFDHMQVKSITSYFNDRAKGISQLVMQEPISASTTNQAGFTSSTPGPLGLSSFNPYTPLFSALYYNKSARSGISEELRFASEPNAKPFNWVAGLYFSSYHQHSYAYDLEDANTLYLSMFGVTEDRRYVSTIAGRPFAGYTDQSDRESKLNENEIAGFGEVNWFLTSRLKLNAGVRVSRNQLNYYTAGGGLQAPPSSVTGTTTESPITPKFGVSYQITDDDLLYFNAAKGYRPGGVNAPIVKGGRCDADLANLGIDSTPATFDSDTVWSYEGGAKVKLFGNRASLAGSVYYIKWNKPQINFTLPLCVAAYTTNAGEAISKGFDLQGNVKIVPGLTGNFNVGYTNSYYPESILGPANANTGVRATLVNSGDHQVGVPKWQAAAGLQYDFDVMGHGAYMRVDYQYVGKAPQSLGPGTSGYAPDAFYTRVNEFVNLRLGVNYRGVDFSVFADNVLNEDRFTPGALSGRSGCSVTSGAACSTYSSYYYLVGGTRPRPRVVGATAVFRY
ncbi:MAG: TonB-dependent receptor [Caulobacteraceae bacterium]